MQASFLLLPFFILSFLLLFQVVLKLKSASALLFFFSFLFSFLSLSLPLHVPFTMSGFYGDLTPKQEQALGQMQEEFQGTDDHTLLRFLRARAFNVKNATEFYQSYLHYRKTSGVEGVLHAKIPKKELFDQLIPHKLHGFDKEGRPVLYEKTGAIDFHTVYKHMNNKDLMKNHVWQMEKQVERCVESSERLGRTVDQFTIVVDLTGLAMVHRKGLKFIRLCAGHDQAYYPERLGRVYLVNAPWVFPWFWKVCRVWLDNNTRKKVNVLNKNFKEKLLEYIDADQLPVEFGGTCDCDGGCVPVPDINHLKNSATVEEELDEADEGEVQNQVISARGFHEVKIDFDEGGGVVEWAWAAVSKDVEFSVEIHSTANISETEEREQEFEVEPERMSSNRGLFECEEATSIVLRWSNEYSRWTSKEIRFVYRVTDLDDGALSDDDVKEAEPSFSDTKDEAATESEPAPVAV